jgi:hypothetical protein
MTDCAVWLNFGRVLVKAWLRADRSIVGLPGLLHERLPLVLYTDVIASPGPIVGAATETIVKGKLRLATLLLQLGPGSDVGSRSLCRPLVTVALRIDQIEGIDGGNL